MPSSGSYDFSVNRNDIINLANEMAGVKGIGRVLSSEDIDRSSMLLNLIVKQFQGKADFQPGLKIWTRKRAYLFPQLNTSTYTLGTSGDNATASYSQTTISANEAIGQTTLSVTTSTGMTAADYIGIRCNDGSLHWSTVSSTGVGTVTIADALTVAADSGATVYWYTTKIMLPLSMISVRRMDTSSNEIPLSPMSLGFYEENILNKATAGNPSAYLYEKGVTTGTLTFDFLINDTTEIYRLTFLRPVEDFDAATDTPDYPQEWFRPLVGQLAIDVATANGRPVTQEMKDYRDSALAIAGNTDPDNAEDVFFQCET